MTTYDDKICLHFLDKHLQETVHPILINLIGVGGTGNHVLWSLADMSAALNGLGHPGFVVRAFDDDTVTKFNLGRQRFAWAEIGEPKAEALINRINRIYGTYWQAMLYPFSSETGAKLDPFLSAQITISCVDNVPSRFDIEEILTSAVSRCQPHAREKPTYWMDFGNKQHTGQVVLSTLQTIEQPPSKLYEPVGQLPPLTDEFRETLSNMKAKTGPSCSMREALSRQSLFINPALAVLGCNLLSTLLMEGMTAYRGFFLNLANYKVAPIPVKLLHQVKKLPASKIPAAA